VASLAESTILKQALLKWSKQGSRLFRNQVGAAYTPAGNRITTGLGKGSSDLIGWTAITITPDMVGKTVAVFTAVECKTVRGKLNAEQQQFLDVVKSSGGIAEVYRGD
jgi:VRR-NUC domain